jgi:protein NrfD
VSDTFFTASPHWTWWVILYFFVGGIAGSAFVLASLLEFFGRPEDRPLARLGHYVAFIGVSLGGLMLVVDLHRPERFWHMLIESNTGRPMFKPWVPMSVGSWGVTLFGLFAFLGALRALSEDRPQWRLLHSGPVRALRGRAASVALAVLGSISGLFLAGYTGVLLSVTNRPIWADSNLVGLLFLISGASTGTATLILLAIWRRAGHPTVLDWLTSLDRRLLILELLVLIAFVVTLGSVAQVLVGWWGIVLLLGVVGVGIVVPLLFERGPGPHTPPQLARAATLVLIGGFLLRMVVILSSNGIHVLDSGVVGR